MAIPVIVARAAPGAGHHQRSIGLHPWWGYAWALGAAAGTTIIASPLSHHLDLTNIVMLYLLGVVAIAFRFGRGPAAAAAVTNVAAMDFFLVPPQFSFAVADAQYLLTFAVMLVTGLLISHLAAKLKHQAEVATLREQRSHDLYELARLLSGTLIDEQIIDAAERFFERSFSTKVILMLRDRAGQLSIPASVGPQSITDTDIALAERAFAGGETPKILTTEHFLYVPLQAPMRVRGVMLVSPTHVATFENADQRLQLETVAVLIAIAIERVHFVTVAREATVQMEGERLRSTLLAALSHDLRTPLTAILGSAELLQIGAPSVGPDHAALVDTIRDQARRTSELVENILDMARLESGSLHLRLEWQSLEEIVGSAIKARATALAAHTVLVAMPPDLPLVECDATLIERIFVNLLENAAKYTRPGSIIRIGAQADAAEMRVWVADNGPGIPRGQESEIFGKFTRANAGADVPGLGLGLAICSAVVVAHGGRIWATSLPHGGAEFTFTLPRGSPPVMDVDPPEST